MIGYCANKVIAVRHSGPKSLLQFRQKAGREGLREAGQASAETEVGARDRSRGGIRYSDVQWDWPAAS